MSIQTNKESLQSKENSIKQSNEITMGKLNYGLSLNQKQLLAFAIYCTQQDGKTEFRKHEFQKMFGIERYNTEDAYEDGKNVKRLEISVKDLKNEYFKFTSVFMEMEYNRGKFIFEWNPKIIPHILELKERYVVTDLQVASHFKSGFSWRLYEYLKAHYGYFRLILSKQEVYELFNVQGRKTYQKSVSEFKRGVLDVAIWEVNKYTELDVRYKEQKDGRSIVGFEIYWNKGQIIQKATQKQIDYIQSIINHVTDNMFIYAQIKNDDKRMRAFEIFEFIKENQNHVIEPININTDKADEIIQEFDFYLNVLNDIVNGDKTKRDTSSYYNWLEEDGNESPM